MVFLLLTAWNGLFFFCVCMGLIIRFYMFFYFVLRKKYIYSNVCAAAYIHIYTSNICHIHDVDQTYLKTIHSESVRCTRPGLSRSRHEEPSYLFIYYSEIWRVAVRRARSVAVAGLIAYNCTRIVNKCDS